jgi:hypothetical protein
MMKEGYFVVSELEDASGLARDVGVKHRHILLLLDMPHRDRAI